MSHVPVFYATTHGQTRRIAERIADRLREHGHASLALDVGSIAADQYDWRHVDGVVLAASVHAGAHQRAADGFARDRLARFNALPSWLVSVSLSAAARNEPERHAAEDLARRFAAQLGWRPLRVTCVAGRLAYTEYGWLTRWMMRRIARKEGGPTDTSRDHELTDWPALDATTRQFAAEVRRAAIVDVPGRPAAFTTA